METSFFRRLVLGICLTKNIGNVDTCIILFTLKLSGLLIIFLYTLVINKILVCFGNTHEMRVQQNANQNTKLYDTYY